ncbi:IS66 family insertion sequence element accessory protein TnpB [Burkholderia vietnamiensis]|uniref:IS66 family insertion sequence element accessory protein TnpB n=1 Tax=Burkholderia vietnamiensis TaxID=60552 RepID=UPI001593E317|nr:IS66 family insertion sequence element accessory protein TnpB [Burkholderia vietnamiensis]
MFRFDENLKVYLHRDPVDFRYGMNSLSILVEQAMRLNPMDSSLYVFTNRRCDRVKILGWQDNGFWLMLKRLEANDRFVWPADCPRRVNFEPPRRPSFEPGWRPV